MVDLHVDAENPLAHSLSEPARRFGFAAAVALLITILSYTIVLAIGLLRLPTAADPIRGPVFVVLELLIIALGPMLVALAVAIHAWADAEVQVYSLCGVVGMSLAALVTCSLHFVIIAIGTQAAMTAWPALPLLLSFTWPSIAYALDILAWDVFFPLGALALAMVFRGTRLTDWIRRLLMGSAVLAFSGLSGVLLNNIAWRNLGIVGYAVVFPVAVALIAILFRRTAPIAV